MSARTTTVGAIAIAVALLSACALEADDVSLGEGESAIAASALAGKQLRATSRTARFAKLTFQTRGGKLAYDADRNATGNTERGTATMRGDRLVLSHDGIDEAFTLRTSGNETLTITPIGSNDADPYVKGPIPAASPLLAPALPAGYRREVRLPNGRTFALRQIVDPTNARYDIVSGYELDHEANVWNPIASSPRTRFPGGSQFIATADGRIVVVGSRWIDGSGAIVEFDTRSNRWSAPIPSTTRASFSVGVCPDGNVLALGGTDGEVPPQPVTSPEGLGSKAHFVDRPEGPAAEVLSPAVVSTKAGLVYVVGGALANDEPWSGRKAGQNAVDWVSVYDCAANTFRALAPMPTIRMNHAATIGDDGRIYVFGGEREHLGAPLESADVYDPRTDTWSALPPPLFARRAFAVPGPDGVLWYGGVSSTIVDAFDPKTGLWTSGLSKSALPPL